ncbi:MAG: 16S rRNA (cytosine(1402)-N(4))-methyltransferase RsmH [Myxococcota bacterium]
MAYHIPVMTEAVVAFLAATPPGPIVDATLGGGGHLAALAAATGDERPLIGVDRDADALEAARQRLESEEGGLPARLALVRGNFGDLPEVLAGAGRPTDHALAGLLLDLGVSSHQLDEASRGFAFKHGDAPLDMRMDPDSGRPTALELLRSWDEAELTRVLKQFGEVRGARRVARAVKAGVDGGTLRTTGDLARAVEAVQKTGRKNKGVHPATTVFQALRIAVNGELEALDAVLAAAPDLLAPGGRVAVISYHSLEDRRVKLAFRRGEKGPERPGTLPPPSDWRPTWRTLTRKPVTASDEEVAANPRARSAKLRVAERAPLDAGGAP